MRGCFRSFLVLVCLTAAGTAAFAQGSFTASLSGTVVDASGGVLPGAEVVAKNNATTAEYRAVTGTDGGFSIPALNPGSYSVTVSLMGFKTLVLSDVQVSTAVPATVRVTLDVGGVTETLVVRGESSSIVQTVSSAIATTMDIHQISNLPLSSRNALDTITSLAGINTASGSRDSTLSGLPQSAINITLDGMSIQDNYLKTTDGFFARLSPRLDAVEEVTVTAAANGADASGQGAAQIRFVTRSGSNDFAGSAYYYYRNDALNANTWFNNRDLPPDPSTGKAPKPDLLQRQPGVRVGGPIVIPGVWDGHNKGFFFVNYEEFRQPSRQTLNRTVLHPSAQQGIFRYNAGGQVREVDLLALAAANGHLATPDPTVARVLADIRAAIGTTGQAVDLSNPLVQRYTFQTPTKNYNPYPAARIDYNLSDRHRLTGSFNYQHINSTPDTTNNRQPSFPGFPVTGSQQSTRWTTSESLRSTLGASMVNEFRIGGTGGATYFSPEFGASLWTGTSIADQRGFHLNLNGACCGSGSTLTNVDTTGNPTFQAREASTKVVEDTLNWIRGSHSIMFGMSFTQGDLWIENQTLVPTIAFGVVPGDPADVMFNPANFPGASATDLNAARGLYALLVGRVSAVTGDARLNEAGDRYEYLGKGLARARLREFDFFAHDSWRLKPTFTINAGLRYVLQLPFYPLNGSYSTATVEDVWGVSGVGNLFKPGTLAGARPTFERYEAGRHAYDTDLDNFAPSLGFAWTTGSDRGWLRRILGGGGDSVVRGGYSIAYERAGMSMFSDVFNANPGLRITGVTDRSQTLGTLGALPVLLRERDRLNPPAFSTTPQYPLTGAITNSVNIFDTNLQIPYSQSWTIGWQRKLTSDMAMELRYVGTRHLQDWTTFNLNEINVVENGFLDEFRLAQQNLDVNIAQGRGPTFRYFGPGTGTAPLPIILAYFSGVPSSQAADASRYTSTLFTNTTFVNTLARFNPNPCCATSTTNPSFAFSLFNDAARRANAIAAGLAPNFFVANPDLLGPANTTFGANINGNGGGTRYNAMQVELRKRLSYGLQVNANYTFGKAYEYVRYSLREPWLQALQTGVDGSVTHAFKSNWVLQLPFGRDRRFASGAGPVLDRIAGGWEFDGVARIASGRMVDFGNVRLVGMSRKELAGAFRLHREADGQLYMLPQDIILNTVRAFNASATSPTGYSALGPPTGRYLAPANGPDCLEIAPSFGRCGTRSLAVTGPRLVRFDLSAVKRVRLVRGMTFEFRAEFLNAFNHPYFVPVTGLVTHTYGGPAPSSSTTTLAAAASDLPVSNSITNNADAFRITQLAGSETARVIQLVTRISW